MPAYRTVYGAKPDPYRWCPYFIRETAVDYTAVTVYGTVSSPKQCVPLRGSLPRRVDTSQMTPIDVLPDDVLLELLGFCLDEDQDTMTRVEALKFLVHVSRCR
jgi:hypothetical protein